MTRRTMMWTTAAVLYTVVNVGGAVYAVLMGEALHAGLHVVLMVVGVGIWQRFGPKRPTPSYDVAADAPAGEVTDRFRNLEQSIDAVAIEVERIGEGQRAMTDLLVDRDGPAVPGGGAPVPGRERDRSS
jgi:hypothetical protein